MRLGQSRLVKGAPQGTKQSSGPGIVQGWDSATLGGVLCSHAPLAMTSRGSFRLTTLSFSCYKDDQGERTHGKGFEHLKVL